VTRPGRKEAENESEYIQMACSGCPARVGNDVQRIRAELD
jgi:hypothetical protein